LHKAADRCCMMLHPNYIEAILSVWWLSRDTARHENHIVGVNRPLSCTEADALCSRRARDAVTQDWA
jgi:hypothetical protein